GSQRMASLIDALLTLSRIARSDAPVRIERGLRNVGDEGLLRVALENLLGNAWKSTRQRENASIEFGSSVKDGRRSFFVRDDGAGFDMAFEDKLFAPFQRLHPPDEFAGTGIGLAIVQRAISRQGGEVWAQSSRGAG